MESETFCQASNELGRRFFLHNFHLTLSLLTKFASAIEIATWTFVRKSLAEVLTVLVKRTIQV